MKPKPWWHRAVAVLLIGATAYYLIRAVSSDWEVVRRFDWTIHPVLLTASLVIHVGVLGWGVFVWRQLLGAIENPPVPFPTLLRIWFLSSLARYIPGKVWQFVAAAELSAKAGLSRAAMLTSLFVHTAFSLLAAVLVAALTLGHSLFPPGGYVLPLGCVVITVAMVHPAVLNRVFTLLPVLLKREIPQWKASWAQGVGLLTLSVLSWMFYGAAFYLMIASLTPVSPGSLITLVGVNALSFLAGYLAVFTPAGLGVREVAMTTLLLPVVPTAVAALLAVAARLWTIAAEVVGGGIALLLSRRGSPRRNAVA